MLYYTIRSKQSSCAFRSSVTALPSSWTSTCFPDSHLTNTCRPPWPWTRVAWAASRCLDLVDLYRTNPSADVSCPRLCVSWKTRNVIGKSNQTQTISNFIGHWQRETLPTVPNISFEEVEVEVLNGSWYIGSMKTLARNGFSLQKIYLQDSDTQTLDKPKVQGVLTGYWRLARAF